MPPEPIDPPATPGFSFAALECESPGSSHVPGRDRAPLRTRLRGHARDGRLLLLDVQGDAPSPALPFRVTQAVVAAVDGATGRAWQLQADQGRFEFGAARVFVHEDVTSQARAAVPPRTVPLATRVFWRVVFALLATRVGRQWLQRRATGA